MNQPNSKKGLIPHVQSISPSSIIYSLPLWKDTRTYNYRGKELVIILYLVMSNNNPPPTTARQARDAASDEDERRVLDMLYKRALENAENAL